MIKYVSNEYPNFASPEQLTGPVITVAAYEAAARINEMTEDTPLYRSDYLSHGVAAVYVKDETRQAGRSFKDRGASNAVAYYALEDAAELVVTSSAGNHGFGVGRAAQQLGLDSLVFMGASATEEKKARIRQLGTEVEVHGQHFDDAYQYGLNFTQREGGQFISPSSPLVIAGHGVIGLELVRDMPDMTHLVLPVGSGGLLAGVASVVKEHLADVQVIAAQVKGCDAFAHSLQTGKAACGWTVDSRFEGVAVGTVHPLTLALARRLVDRVVVVEPESIYQTVYRHHRATGQLLETAGALSPTVAEQIAKQLSCDSQANIAAIASGANPPHTLEADVYTIADRYNW